MTRQSYLVVYDKTNCPAICYFSLEDGYLRQYTTMDCTKCMNEMQLSGCKITVKAQKRTDGMPHSFYLETRRVFVKDRSFTLGHAKRMEFSACSSDDRKEWGKALFSWQRYYWRDPHIASSEKNVCASKTYLHLEQLLAKYCVPKPSNGHSISFAVVKQPFSFLQRNAYSLQRSLSLAIASTGVKTTKLEIDEETPDYVKKKMGLDETECPEADKSNMICQATTVTPPQYTPGTFTCGVTQKAYY